MCDICVNELSDEERAALPPATRVRHGLTPRPEIPPDDEWADETHHTEEE